MTLFYDDERSDAIREGDGIVDLFAGPGGWSVALAERGLRDVGIELNSFACSTRRRNGHLTVEASVADVDPVDFTGAHGLIASPPCQAFSSAGKKHGTLALGDLRQLIESGSWDARPSPDPRVWLPLEVGRWCETLLPRWVAMEQVPGALPLWESFAVWLISRGYSTWTGIVNAADYGVPQTRRRAILLASRDVLVDRPRPTHSATGSDGLPRWVSLADALGDRDRSLQVLVNTGRAWNQHRNGAQTIDCSETPAPTFTTKSGSQWNIGDGQRGKHARRVSIADALVIQSFPADYAVSGSLADQFEQIGNAVPPRLAAALLEPLLVASVIDAPTVG